MSLLTLLRHAQASFFADDYDQLSSHGERQAAMLADYLLKNMRSFDSVYTGTLKRHRRTCEILAERYRAAEIPFPDATTLAGLNEHHVDQLLREELDSLATQYPHLLPLVTGYRRAASPDDKQASFQRLFEQLVEIWVNGHTGATIESWTDFCNRVLDALQRIRCENSSSGRNVLVVTSVGPLAVALLTVLQCSETTALQMGWRLWNCSLTNLVYSGERITLDNFNSLPHLPDQADWTYR